MPQRSFAAFINAALAGGAMLALPSSPASAFPRPAAIAETFDASARIEEVDWRFGGGGGFRGGGFRGGGFRGAGFRDGGSREGGLRDGGLREGGYRDGGWHRPVSGSPGLESGSHDPESGWRRPGSGWRHPGCGWGAPRWDAAGCYAEGPPVRQLAIGPPPEVVPPLRNFVARPLTPPIAPTRTAFAHAPPPTTIPPAGTTGAHGLPPTPKVVPPPPNVAALAFPPPLGETRFRRGEILVAIRGAPPKANIDSILQRHRLQEAEFAQIDLLGTSWRLWRITDARDVTSVVRELGAETSLASVQPNYVYSMQQDQGAPPAEPAQMAGPQYALAKLRVDATRAFVTGDKVLVAVIDTAVEETHPELAGAIEDRFDALGGATITRAHGTSMVGAIAARGMIQGVAPKVRILSARACDGAGEPECTTFAVVKAVDWAWKAHARIVNMSIAGPKDPALHDVLAAAFGQGMVLVSAAGNAGRESKPLYPAADENVVAVTATTPDDKHYEKANVGRYIAVAAPGVEVLLPTPHGNYDFISGTSVSSALVSGVAALLLERRPNIAPGEMRKLLTSTAKPLGAADEAVEFGSGLVDAERALSQAGLSHFAY